MKANKPFVNVATYGNKHFINSSNNLIKIELILVQPCLFYIVQRVAILY